MSENTFYSLLKKSAESYPDSTAILYDTYAITYAGLFRDCCKKAIYFRQFDRKRIALIGPGIVPLDCQFFRSDNGRQRCCAS